MPKETIESWKVFLRGRDIINLRNLHQFCTISQKSLKRLFTSTWVRCPSCIHSHGQSAQSAWPDTGTFEEHHSAIYRHIIPSGFLNTVQTRSLPYFDSLNSNFFFAQLSCEVTQKSNLPSEKGKSVLNEALEVDSTKYAWTGYFVKKILSK